MKRYIVSIVFLLFLSQVAKSQIIKGRLLDVETDSAVSFASVYFSAAYKGTSSDNEGYFQLPVSEYQGQTIVFSSLGYESAFLEKYEEGTFYEIHMKPRQTLLEDVVVEPDEMPRELKERIFKNQFLGRSDNALSCKVQNMEDIRLVYFKSSKTLEGFCDKPIIIQNTALGYKINYYLERFESKSKSIVYQGNFFFENDTSVSKRKFKKIKKRRRSAYRGSRMHFFRTLWGDKLKKEKWRILSSKKKRLEYQDVVMDKAPQKFFQSSVPLTIWYRKKSPTFLQFKKPEIIFSEKGHFDPSGLNWSGEMSNERVGDLLPFGYIPKSKFNNLK
jgi:hypothetical protein